MLNSFGKRMTAARRMYILTHPIALSVALSIFLAGSILVVGVSPDLALTGLPVWVQTTWHLAYTLGGLGLGWGIWRNSPNVESAGLMLLAGAFAASAVAQIGFLPFDQALPGVVFLIGLSMGCVARFVILLYYLPRHARSRSG